MENKVKRRVNRQKTATIKLASNDIGIELQKKYFDEDSNYIDYFLEIGAKPEIFKFNYLYESDSLDDINDNLVPQVICKFPNFDKKNVVIDNGIINQIFPQGFIAVESQTPPEPIFFCLTLDNQLLSMVYTTKFLACLIIYEDICNYRKLYDKYLEEDSKFTSALLGAVKPKNVEDRKTTQKYYIPKCLCLVSVHAYIDKYEEILRTLYGLSLENKYPTLFIDHIIEKLVTETPKVPRGYKKVVLQFPNNQIDISENKMNELPSINTNLIRLFDILSVGNIIEIFRYLLFETKLIFFSKDLYDLTNTLLSFLFLLSPFKYQFQIVSILPKDLYSYIETISPYIFGINEEYTESFFKDNKVDIEDSTICVIDIDNDRFLIAPKKKSEDFPEFPKKLCKKLEMKLTQCNFDFKKDKTYLKTICNLKNIIQCKNKIEGNNNLTYNIKEMNEKYQLCFYKFMIGMFIDYPKYLTKDYSVNKDISMSIQDMVDINNYLNNFSSSERPFYSKIFNTQLFIEFIYKRMMPKDCREKVEVLFFEEKINEKVASKNLFNKSKLKSQNVLLNSKDYDFDNEIQYINLKENDNLSPSLTNYIFSKKDSLLKDFLYKGYIVDINEAEQKITFSYTLFPSLISDKFFILNADSYVPPINYDKEMDNINTKLVNKSYLKFIQKEKDLKNSEVENDLYICYLIIWSLVFWYNDDCERELRFLEMLKILEKIEEHDIKPFEQLFKALVEYSNDENVIIVYKKFIHLRLNPTWEIFSLVSKIIKKKQNIRKKNQLLLQDTKANDLNEKFIKENKMENISDIRQRVLIYQNKEDKFFSSNALFYAYLRCEKCKSVINLKDLFSNLSSLYFEKDKNEKQRIKCRNKNKINACNDFYDTTIKINLGKELYHKKTIAEVYSYSIYDQIKTSIVGEIVFMSPDEIKKKLLNICEQLKKDTKFDVELFRILYPDIFWNLILYFQFNSIDISFMLPYAPFTTSTKEEQFEKDIKKHITYVRDNNQVNSNEVLSNKSDMNNEYIIDLTDEENKNEVQIFTKRIKTSYKTEDLIWQNVYNLEICQNLGMISHKGVFSFEENIGYNELPFISQEKDNNSTLNDSLNQINEEDLDIIDKKNKRHRRNLSSSMVEEMPNKRISKSRANIRQLRQPSNKKEKRENSVELKCFEFEESDSYSSSDENKK